MSNGLRVDLEGHWSLDEAAGENRLDSTPNGNDAVDNATTESVAGVVGNCVHAGFGGSTTKFLTVTNDPAFVFGDEDFTIAGFFWLQTVVASHAIGGLWNQQTVNRRSYLLLYQQSVASIRFGVSADGTTPTFLDFSWNTGQVFAHFAAIHDAANNQLRLHVTPITESEVAAAVTAAHAGGAFENTTDTLDIGRVRVSSTLVGNSRIDELAIWRRALTLTDLNAHFNGGAGLAFSEWDFGVSAPVGAFHFFYR